VDALGVVGGWALSLAVVGFAVNVVFQCIILLLLLLLLILMRAD
jgi:hypothetical protein